MKAEKAIDIELILCRNETSTRPRVARQRQDQGVFADLLSNKLSQGIDPLPMDNLIFKSNVEIQNDRPSIQTQI